MRFHTLKVSPTKNLLIADSQIKDWHLPNYNILAFPGARICNALDFLLNKQDYEIIVVFLGANDLFRKAREPSLATPDCVARELDQLGQRLAQLANKVFILGLPHRLDYPKRTQVVNNLLNNLQKNKGWAYRRLSEKIYSNRKREGDKSEPKPVSAEEDKVTEYTSQKLR